MGKIPILGQQLRERLQRSGYRRVTIPSRTREFDTDVVLQRFRCKRRRRQVRTLQAFLREVAKGDTFTRMNQV